jgi:V/A-type H+-transporting ATPase subunit I
MPEHSTAQMRQRIVQCGERIRTIDATVSEFADYADAIAKAIAACEKEVEFETFATGMMSESLSDSEKQKVSVAYFTGYVEEENLPRLKETAKTRSWGLLTEDPTEEDNVPTKLKNNRFVSLIYPLTDFLGTVPGYFEYDISGWFLAFILIFFGIIFGDGAYGLPYAWHSGDHTRHARASLRTTGLWARHCYSRWYP